MNGSQIVSETWGEHLVLYFYDADGAPIGMQYRNTSYSEGVFDVYWFEKNLQGDIVAVYNQSGTQLIAYTYDAWGNCTTTYYNGGSSSTAKYNPFLYRGYYFDSELGFCYLNSRYYDPAISRFVTADKLSTVKASSFSLTDGNLYAYCDNNPVMRTDNGGAFWDTFFDVASLVVSVVEVVANPTDPTNWIGLVGDAVDLVPFVTGVGEVARVVKTGKKVVETADDIHDASKVVDNAKDTANIIKKATTGSSNDIGKIGEKLAGINPKAKTIIEINGRRRIPDAMTDTLLKEVKNVKYISNTQQLRDFAQFANDTGRTLELWVRPNTKVAKTVIDAGWKIKYLW